MAPPAGDDKTNTAQYDAAFFWYFKSNISVKSVALAPVLQVRRMAGALVAVGQGKLSVRQLKELMEARDSLAYPQQILAPARGLFLAKVDYREAGEWRPNKNK